MHHCTCSRPKHEKPLKPGIVNNSALRIKISQGFRSIFKMYFNIWKLSDLSNKRWLIDPPRKETVFLVCSNADQSFNPLQISLRVWNRYFKVLTVPPRAHQLPTKPGCIEFLHSIRCHKEPRLVCAWSGGIKARWNAKLLSSSPAQNRSAVCLLKSCYENKSDMPHLLGQRQSAVSQYAVCHDIKCITEAKSVIRLQRQTLKI